MSKHRYDCAECEVQNADPGLVLLHVNRTGHKMVRSDASTEGCE